MNRPYESAAGRYRAVVRALVSVSMAVLLAACAAKSAQRQTGSVQERAQARWDALLAGDLDTAYSMYSPGYRSANSRVDFEIELRTRRVQYTAANVMESHCEGDACTVVTTVGYRIGSPVPGVPKWESERRIEERWVRTQGEWWYVPES